MVGILVSFWDGLFSGAMLVSRRVSLTVIISEGVDMGHRPKRLQFKHTAAVFIELTGAQKL